MSRLSDDEKRVFTDRIEKWKNRALSFQLDDEGNRILWSALYADHDMIKMELEAAVAGMRDKWTPPDEMTVIQNHVSLLKNENERLTKRLEEADEQVDKWVRMSGNLQTELASLQAGVEVGALATAENKRLTEENTLLAEHNQALQKENTQFRDVMNGSHGVMGLHLNDELTTWDWLIHNEWLDALLEEQEHDGPR